MNALPPKLRFPELGDAISSELFLESAVLGIRANVQAAKEAGDYQRGYEQRLRGELKSAGHGGIVWRL